jgi:hypothetical protein
LIIVMQYLPEWQIVSPAIIKSWQEFSNVRKGKQVLTMARKMKQHASGSQEANHGTIGENQDGKFIWWSMQWESDSLKHSPSAY